MSYPSPIQRMREADYAGTTPHRAAGTGCNPYGCAAVLVSVAFGIVGLLLLALGIDGVVARSSHGVAGTVTISDCATEYDGGDVIGYTCSGRFSAADGSFEIPRLKVNPRFDEVPGEPVAATVTNAHASVAHQPGNNWLMQLCAGFFMLIMAFWMLTALS